MWTKSLHDREIQLINGETNMILNDRGYDILRCPYSSIRSELQWELGSLH